MLHIGVLEQDGINWLYISSEDPEDEAFEVNHVLVACGPRAQKDLAVARVEMNILSNVLGIGGMPRSLLKWDL